MTLLFITQKLHDQDAFTVLWVRAFVKMGYDVRVVCLENRLRDDAHPDFAVHSLGKERGNGKIAQVLTFWKVIMTLKYDRVFIHMAPIWYALGWKWWLLTGKPCYLWYTHYKMQLGVWLFGFFGRRFFCATEQSLPQFAGSPKKVVTGHGIDLAFWPKRENRASDPKKLITVHRLSRSKRLEIVLGALNLLPGYHLDIYGIPAETDYADELRTLTETHGLSSRVLFHGTIPMEQLPDIYTTHRLILNMASETIDKTMLEAMTCGCYPVTTKRNADAIGIPEAPEQDTAEAVAAFIQHHADRAPMTADALYDVVRQRHSLEQLMKTMDTYIRPGT